MKPGRRGGGGVPVGPALFALAIAFGALPRPAVAQPAAHIEVSPPPQNVFCTGEYADDISALLPQAREFERSPATSYAYAIRNSATYECLSYGQDGKVRRVHRQAVAHGTGFAYAHHLDETYLLTNEHVATWPSVTTPEHPAEGIPEGCKKIKEVLRVVRDEADDFAPGFLPLAKVVSDPTLDVAILKAAKRLNLMPYRVGRSALLRAGNVVQVRGFPLGTLQATNVGKVVNAYDHDMERGWDHIDFVVDALLARGSSGSPVFAVSCRTGQLELVGLFHASYRNASALNVVVGIDQLREMMETLKRPKRTPSALDSPLGPEDRQRVLAAAVGPLLFFRVGDRLARVMATPEGALRFEYFAEEFPAHDTPALVLTEVTGSGFGALKEIGFAGQEGLRFLDGKAADSETQELANRLLDLSGRQVLRELEYREAAVRGRTVRESHRRAAELLAEMDKAANDGRDLLRGLIEAGDRIPDVLPVAQGALDGGFAPQSAAGTAGSSAQAVEGGAAQVAPGGPAKSRPPVAGAGGE